MTKRERDRIENAKWDAVWERLASEGRVNVPPDPKPPYCTSSCAALAQAAENPGARLNVRVIAQNRIGVGGAE